MMTQTIAQNTVPDTITDFDKWCDFIMDGTDQVPDNGDSKQALADDAE